MSVAAAGSARPSPAQALRSVHVGLRGDLEVTRHVFRGQPAYVVRDPMTFQSQRLSPADYDVFVRINSSQPLGAIFDSLVEQGKVEPKDEDGFYEFDMTLHRVAFLRLPLSDDKVLYRRYAARVRARRREKIMGFLFLRVPIWNPDEFLNRTIRFARPLFSWAAMAAWLCLLIVAGLVAASQWEALRQPAVGLLTVGNLPVMFFTLILLKVFHEFGHAFACKRYGGHVPEMGVFLIIFTPCAYVDATACWGFTSRRQRLVVSLAGMYVESIIAAIALLVWASSDPSLLRDVAYNVIVLAGVVTVLFNINPLMRFDGYYILSDLLEIPNLRARASQYVVQELKRRLLGVTTEPRPAGRRLRAILFSYGIAASIYKACLTLAIAGLLASKMLIVGGVLAVLYVGNTVVSLVRRICVYLWFAKETASIRPRAVAVSILLLVVLPIGLALIPLPAHVQADGVITSEHATYIRAQSAGFLAATNVRSGEWVEAGQLLVRLENDEYQEKINDARANLAGTEILREAYRFDNPSRSLQEAARARSYQAALTRHEAKLADLDIGAPRSGRVISCLRDGQIGIFIHEADPVATIAAGKPQLTALLTEAQIISARPRIGDRVSFRAADQPDRLISGTIARIASAGSRSIKHPTLTHPAGGTIAVDPLTAQAAQPYFELTIDLDTSGDELWLHHGMTGTVRLRAGAEPIGLSLFRRLLRFTDLLLRA